MKFNIQQIPLRDIYEGYSDDEENGVYAYGRKLCCRPAYQREFIYKDKQRDAVVESVMRDMPLNVFYWSQNENPDTHEITYELMDGQQRTLSLMQYIDGEFSVNYQYFFNLTDSQKNQILDYKLTVYICEGTDEEKLDWFQTINIAGEKLTDQELLNAIYSGKWVTDAKRYFSKNNCVASNLASDYMNGNPIRQDYLHTVLEWKADEENIAVEEYMARHQHDNSANTLWRYFQNVINWVKVTFPVKRKIMKGLPWGIYYNALKNNNYDSDALEIRIKELLLDDDVTNLKGIYIYLLTGKEKHLNIRAFSESDKMRKYKEQGGVCPMCGETFLYEKMDGDHILPWSQGGKTEYSNLQMLCIACNRSH